MKLFYSTGACSLSPRIALREAGASFEAVKVGRDKKTSDGRDFRDINIYGYVPALELDDGAVLVEGPAIVQYIADRWPDAKLAPLNGTLERYRVQSALGFINSELHKLIGSLFHAMPQEQKAATLQKIDTRLGQLSTQMEGKAWVANDIYSVADIYLFVVFRWLAVSHIDLGRWPVLAAHQAAVAVRPAVRQALADEQLT